MPNLFLTQVLEIKLKSSLFESKHYWLSVTQPFDTGAGIL